MKLRPIALSLLIVLGTINVIKAQFVSIPDPAFKGFLLTDYSSCFDAQQRMDTTCSDIVNEESIMIFGSAIENLDGIQYFDHLRELACTQSNLTKLPRLPQELEFLSLDGNKIDSLSQLPPTLKRLLVDDNNLKGLPDSLPEGLEWLFCQRNRLSMVNRLPQHLKRLSCAFNQITNLPSLGDTLEDLNCAFNKLISLPYLPMKLKYLVCDSNQITHLPVLPYGLESVSCVDNKLSTLPTLPNTLVGLFASGNCFMDIPQNPFPNTLTSFVVSPNGNSCVITDILEQDSLSHPPFFPNPATDILHFTKTETYTVFNDLGQQVREVTGLEINLEGLNNGIYFLRVGDTVAKFAKK